MYGRLPFDERNKDRLYDKIMDCRYNLPPGPSSGFMKMIKKIFVRDTNKRARFDDILKDPWFIGKGLGLNVLSEIEREEKIGEGLLLRLPDAHTQLCKD